MRLLLPLLTALVAALPAAAPDTPVAVPNAGFETAGAAALPSGWSLDGPAPAGAAARRADGGHGGAAAIELGADAPASLSVLSEKVALRVGHVYRLSAWVKTRDAAADPLARYPTAVPGDALDGVVPVHEPLPGRRRHEGLDARRDDVRRHRGRGPGAARPRPQRDGHRPRLVRRRHARRGRRHHGGHPPRARALGGAGLPLRGPRLDLRARGGRALRARPPVREAGLRRDRRLHPEALDPPRREGPRPRLGRPAHAGRRAHAAPLRPRVPRGDEGHRGRRGRGGGGGPRPQGRPRGRRHHELGDRPRLDGGRSPGDAERRHRAERSSRPRTSSPCPTASTSARPSPRRAPPPPTAGRSSSRSSCGTATPASTSTWCSTWCPRRATAS